MLTPEKLAGKIAELRKFKEDVKKISSSFDEEKKEDVAKKKIINLYRKKYNQVLAAQFSQSSSVANMASTIGEEQLIDEERILLSLQKGSNDVEKNLSRRDRFVHGADVEYVDGERQQISKGLKMFAENIADEYERNEYEKFDRIKEKGYDPQKIFEKSVSRALKCLLKILLTSMNVTNMKNLIE